MKLYTVDTLKNQDYEELSLIQGRAVVLNSVGCTFKSLVGTDMDKNTEILEKVRNTATSVMVKEAEKLEADAIISIRYEAPSILEGALYITVYGTAIKFR